MDRIKFFQDTIIAILKDNADYYKGTTNPLNLLVIADIIGFLRCQSTLRVHSLMQNSHNFDD